LKSRLACRACYRRAWAKDVVRLHSRPNCSRGCARRARLFARPKRALFPSSTCRRGKAKAGARRPAANSLPSATMRSCEWAGPILFHLPSLRPLSARKRGICPRSRRGHSGPDSGPDGIAKAEPLAAVLAPRVHARCARLCCLRGCEAGWETCPTLGVPPR